MKKLLVSIISTLVLLIPAVVNAEPVINKTSLEIKVGESSSLSVSGVEEGQTVSWSSDSSNATVSNSGSVTGVSTGTAKITATVKNSNEEVVATFDCNVTIAANSEADTVDLTLSELKAEGGTLSSPTVDRENNKTKYTLTVTDKDNLSISFKPTVTDTNKVSVMKNFNDSDKLLKNFKNNEKAKIILTNQLLDENNSKRSYSYEITIKYEEEEQEISCDLKDLTVVGYNLKFASYTAIYNLNVPHSVSEVTIKAEQENNKATMVYGGKNADGVAIKYDGEKATNLAVGENHIKITISNGQETKTYTINITRKATNDTEKEKEEEEEEVQEEETTGEETTAEPTSQPEEKKGLPNPDPIFNRIAVTFGCLIGFALGGFGIYFYNKTSPKNMKKELMKEKKKKEESPIVEAKAKPKAEVLEDLEETKEYKINK